MKLKYEFDCGADYEYIDYEGTEFIYEVDDDDIKYDIVKSEIKKLEMDINPFDLIDIFNDMLLWDNLIDEDEIKSEYKNAAMSWFKDNHKEEDHEAYEADAYNDERRCEE